ncbi:MAG: protein kinase [Acidobacteria bacterium]|nr:protein kinase [Acidobacteriota bacterium]
MSPEKWQHIKQLFNAAVELATAERQTFLATACADEEVRGEVEKMLAADAATALDHSPVSLLTEDEYATFRNQLIGRYRILGEVGRGGMGAVFAAARADGEFDQKVAVKIIKRGLTTADMVRRFRHERQILASLEHPHIARLLDGGMSAEGLPFYVMEFIEGVPIDQYCNLRELGVSAKLKLFLQVCAAVSYAHRRLIVHRDLKPSNIFVTDNSEVKLLDFGIAKVVSQSDNSDRNTATQLGMMTPAYASPEQFRGETVTTATDVYSLGVVLYELLTGTRPYDLTGLRLDEILKVVCETEPPRPSRAIAACGLQMAEYKSVEFKAATPSTDRINSAQANLQNAERKKNPQAASRKPQFLKGDLDNIILKALKKAPERRYESVERFAEDLRRYLNGLPVSARPDTFAYRASKFIRRNKVGVLAAALIFLALIAGLLGITYQARVAQQERARAEKRFDQVRKLANNVVFKYHDAIANLPGATATREMLVKDAIEYLDNLSEDAQDNPALQHELALAYLKIGNVQGETYRANLGDSQGALISYQRSVEIFNDLLRGNPDHPEYLKNLLQSLHMKALLLVRLQQWQKAEQSGQQQLDIAQRLVEKAPENQDYRNLLARSYQVKGDTVEFTGGDEETLKWYRRSLEEAEQGFARNPADEMARRLLTVALQRTGTRLEYVAARRRQQGATAATLAASFIEAEQLHRRSVVLSESLQHDFPQMEAYRRFVAATSINLGTAMARIGKGNEGIPYILRSLETMRGIAEADPKNNEARRDLAELWQYMAFAREAMNQSAEAIAANLKSLKILEEITANDPSNVEFLKQTHLTYHNTGDIFLQQGKRAEALAYYQKGLAYAEKMAALNSSSQITILHSESRRKIGEAYLAIAVINKNAEAMNAARQHLEKAREELLLLKDRGELGKNDEHKLALIERDLNQTTRPL